MSAGDVIFAVASGQGRAGIAVMRISGSTAASVFRHLAGLHEPPEARRATLLTLQDPSDGEQLDRALGLWFPAPASFTGEDVVELHIHGGLAVVAGVAEALNRLPNVRPAEAGEFTRRAFLNGKLDLAEAEGLADLIEADTAFVRKRAIWQMDGGLSAIYAGWQDRLTESLALVEAALDFSDEPIPDDLDLAVRRDVAALLAAFETALAQSSIQERVHHGLRVVLSGPPNVGKSSLLNRLSGREAAIVTEIPGTTRDILEVRLEIGGYPLVFCDTAGLRETNDPVEIEGVARARLAAQEADVVIEMWAPDSAKDFRCGRKDSLVFWNKADLFPDFSPPAGIFGSVKTGKGLSELEAALTAKARSAMDSAASPAITRSRHRAALRDAATALERALTAPAVELMAEDLRLASRALGRVTGTVDVEQLLDRIFSSFCIGK